MKNKWYNDSLRVLMHNNKISVHDLSDGDPEQTNELLEYEADRYRLSEDRYKQWFLRACKVVNEREKRSA